MTTLRHFILLLALAITPMQLFAGEALTEEKQDWLILERQGTAYPEIVTILRELPPLERRRKFPILLMIKWGYNSRPDGLPTDDELVKARSLYETLDRIIGDRGVYAMSRTGDGGRTLYYYVSDAEAITPAINKYFDARPPVSIRVFAIKEPDWGSVGNVLKSVR